MTTAGSRNTSTADVVVVGGGGSGLFAAISAAERGLRTILVEKTPQLGGSTGMSIGSISAAGTSLQAAKHISDSSELFRADLRRMNGDLEAQRVFRRLAVGASSTGWQEWSNQTQPSASRFVIIVIALLRSLRTYASRTGRDIEKAPKSQQVAESLTSDLDIAYRC